jgi:hypothetical protein
MAWNVTDSIATECRPVLRKVRTIEVEGLHDGSDPWRNPPRIRGKVLLRGQRARVPYEDAAALEKLGKVKIIFGADKFEVMQF